MGEPKQPKMFDMTYGPKLPDPIGCAGSTFACNDLKVSWHYVVKDMRHAPTDDTVLPGMVTLNVTDYQLYKFSEQREWVLDKELTDLYQQLVAVG